MCHFTKEDIAKNGREYNQGNIIIINIIEKMVI
jgi:hypothetical protein